MSLSHQHVEYAGFLRRLSAFCLDGVFISVITSILFIVLFGSELMQMTVPTSLQDLNWKVLSLEHGFPLVWTIGFWLLWMATPGKLLMDCQIVDARSLNKARKSQLIARYFAYIVSAIPLGLGFLWVLIDKKNQSWHDKISGTVVVMQDDSMLTLEALSYQRVN